MHGAISHTSRCPPDVILRRSFTRPSTTLGDRRPGNEAMFSQLQPLAIQELKPVILGMARG